MKQTRRKFIQNTAITAVGASTLLYTGCGPAKDPGAKITLRPPRDPNKILRVASVGLRGRGKSLLKQIANNKQCVLVVLCDPDLEQIDARRKDGIKGKYGDDARIKEMFKTAEGIQDYRAVLERDDIDVVVLTTPNHQHAIQMIWATEAGKDVYVEKPACHSIWEGRQMIAAAKQHDAIVQVGLQNRSDVGLQAAFAWIQAGNVGKITEVRGLCYKNRSAISTIKKPYVAPDTFDYNLWLGPAADLPIYRDSLHYDWHWSWNTGNGDNGNQGPHELDIMRWVMGDPEDEIITTKTIGARFAWGDSGETPNTLFVRHKWGKDGIPVSFELRDLKRDPESNVKVAFPHSGPTSIIVTCEGGIFRGGRGGGHVYELNDPKKRIESFKGDSGKNHFNNFVEAVRYHDKSKLACNIETGVRSSILPMLANISHRTGHEASVDATQKYAAHDALMNEGFDRYSKHLEAWNIDYKNDPWTLGSELSFDAKQWKFIGDSSKEANANLKREEYRAPFTIKQYV